MQTKRLQLFTAIRTEGAILPADLLQRVAEGDGKLDGLRPEDYHLSGEKLNEAINRSWNRLLGAWKAFQNALEKLPDDDPATSVTREKWLLPLFRELDYGRLPGAKAIEIEEKSYPISHFWEQTPIHLLGWRIELDRRTRGVAGAATTSPHSMIQEFLNRSDDHLWAFLSNGQTLRILRDNVSLTRQAYVEFDLKAMMAGEVYADFKLLWLICHQSRVEIAGNRESGAIGSRVSFPDSRLPAQDYYRQLLRVVYRLLFLFVAEDRELLLDPNADEEARQRYTRYYSTFRLRQLAERHRGTRHSDLYHGLILVMEKLGSDEGCPGLGLPALGSFLWSKDAIRDLAGITVGSEKSAVGNREEQNHTTPDSQFPTPPCSIANAELLATVRELAFTVDANVLRAVDYKNLGAEELGSIYESLLELHPEINQDAGTFELGTAAGHERKTTGSYYTPTSLINCLLDSALDPVVEEAAKGNRESQGGSRQSAVGNRGIQDPDSPSFPDSRPPDLPTSPEERILALRVCDPACGSGHFLIAAAHRIGKRLAAVRTGDDEPAPDAVRHAVRDVIGNCIFGVDLNPMAVELCKINLWLESLEPGKPLSFLDHHIQCGNSLLGATPALLKKGIPDEAFKPIEGDDKKVCNEMNRLNRDERRGQKTFDFQGRGKPWERMGDLATSLAQLDEADDATVADVRSKQERYEKLVASSGYLFGRLWADAWCAAFVWKKTKEFDYGLTEEVFRQIERNPHGIVPWMRDEIQRLAKQYRLFHWHLAFPQVFRVLAADEDPENEQTGWDGGFDVVLGNPPWERLRMEEQQFFAAIRPDIAEATSARRSRMIRDLKTADARLYDEWTDHCRATEGSSALIRHTGRYPLTGKGKFNTAGLFVETSLYLLSKAGRAGLIAPTGIVTDDAAKDLFGALVHTPSLYCVFDFENRKRLFPDVDIRYRFSIIAFGRSPADQPSFKAAFLLSSLNQLADDGRICSLSADDISRINPNSKTCPVVKDNRDLAILRRCHRRHPVFIQQQPQSNPWQSRATYMFQMSDTKGEFVDLADVSISQQSGSLNAHVDSNPGEYVPLYEAKLIHQFDHRFATFFGQSNDDCKAGNARELEPTEKRPDAVAVPRFFLPKHLFVERMEKRPRHGQWLIGYREITNATNERTLVAAFIPYVAAGRKIPQIYVGTNTRETTCLVAAFNSFIVDFVARCKLSSTSISNAFLSQVPIPEPSSFQESLLNVDWADWLSPRVVELTYTAWDLEPFAHDCGYDGPPFCWDEERRFLLRCELDAAYFHLYLGTPEEWQQGSPELLKEFPVPRNAVDYIMETFPIVKRKDEQKHGEYRTKRVILEIYDAMQKAIDTGQSYQTRLYPPPGPPTDAEGNFIPISEWDPNNWPSHIHPPRSREKSEVGNSS